jgi:uncharacterized damage-inducible protein DinB
MKAHFSKMARYNAWANARLYGMARGLPDASYRQNVGAFFGSLHGTLNHLLVTDRIWMHRFTGIGDSPKTLDAILFEDLPSLELARQKEDAGIVQYIDGLSNSDIGHDVTYVMTNGIPQRYPLEDLLAHLFNHQTHHRGQAHTILTLLGIAEPPPLDLSAMLRESGQNAPQGR